jgi:hypothetical protein
MDSRAATYERALWGGFSGEMPVICACEKNCGLITRDSFF